MSAAQEYKNDQLEGLLVYYFCVISECFAQEKISLKTLEESEIEAFEEPFFEMLDKYFDNDDQDIVDEFCDQPELFRFMISEITTADEDGTTLDDETATQLFIVTLAMMTLMSRVGN